MSFRLRGKVKIKIKINLLFVLCEMEGEPQNERKQVSTKEGEEPKKHSKEKKSVIFSSLKDLFYVSYSNWRLHVYLYMIL